LREKESVVKRTGDSTCCLRDSKGLYLYYLVQGCATADQSALTHI
jgi:hypothetical protein